MPGVIRIDDGVSDYHVARIRRASDDLPTEAAITVVNGNREEDAPEQFTQKLEDVAAQIADRVTAIRNFASRNADALAHAVRLLQEHDQITADEARRMTALIDDIHATPTTTPSTAPASAPSSSDDAAKSRSGFGG